MVSITTPGEEELHFRNSELDWMVPWTRSWMMMEAGRLPEYSSAPGGSSISAASGELSASAAARADQS